MQTVSDPLVRSVSLFSARAWLLGVSLLAASLPAVVHAQTLIPKSGYTLQYVDSQETVGAQNAATNAFDGNAATLWHSQWYDSKPALPHEIRINLGGTYNVAGFRYLPRQDGKPNGRIGRYEFYVSTDGTNWGTAVATGTFANDAAEKQVTFTARSGRYVRLRALSDLSGTNYRTSAAEIGILQAGGTGTQGPTAISRSGWNLLFVDSEETSYVVTEGKKGLATYAYDGNSRTVWHTDTNEAKPRPPHWITVDMGSVKTVSGFRYLPRQDGNEKGRIGEFEFLVSTDGSWTTPAASGRLANTQEEQQVLFTPRQARYFKLRAVDEVTGSFSTAIAEFNVLQPASGTNTAPNGSITNPSANATIPVGGSIAFSGSGSDPENHTPLSYRWSFGKGSGIPDQTVKDPGFVRFERPGTYTVTLTVADARGLVDGSPATRTITVRSGATVPTSAWTVRYVDSQETSAGNYAAARAFDGNPSTFWYTQYSSQQPAPPHEIQINLGATYAINGFTYLPRQDSNWDGRIGHYEFYVSADGTNWGEPVTEGVFGNTAELKEVFFVTTPARYIRLRALTEVSGKPSIGVAELQVLAAAPVVPSVILLTPRTFDYQRGADLYALTDANLASGQGVRFLLDGSRRVDVYDPPFEAMFTGVARGDHDLLVQVIDSGGNSVSGAATRDYATQIGIGDYYVGVGDSITYGIGDDIVDDNGSLDGRNPYAGYTPILQDLLTVAKGSPVAVFNEGLPGENSVSGAARIKALLQKHPEAQRFLIMYGTNDAGESRASGAGLSPGASGYAGSYKDYMQRIINAVNAAGKQAVIARLPPYAPVNGTRDKFIQQYNQVIQELAANSANRLTLPSPDLYTYFSTRTSTHYIPDYIHPNGKGYQSIANLWFNVLNGR